MRDRELSRDPHRIRRRLRRGTNPERDLAMLQEAGLKPVSEWDDEELARGKPRNIKGSFSGATPPYLSPVIEEERRKRLKQATYNRLMPHSLVAMDVLGALVKNPKTPAGVRADIAKFIYEQQHGKAKAHVDAVVMSSPIAAAVVLDDGLPQDKPIVLEGEFTEDEEPTRRKDAVVPHGGVDDDNPLPGVIRDGGDSVRIA